MAKSQKIKSLTRKAVKLLSEEKWAEAFPVCRELCKLTPTDYSPFDHWPFCHAALCLFHLGRFQQAKEMLIAGPESCRENPVFFHSFACIEVALGNHEEAIEYARAAMRLNLAYQNILREDMDLEPIWEQLAIPPSATTNEDNGNPLRLRQKVGDGPQLSPPQRSNGHPVADNPLRLLYNPTLQECTLKDLLKNARLLKLQAKQRDIDPEEPFKEISPRIRAAEDYAVAENQISNPTQLAVCIAFWPDDFGGKNPMQQANLWLLQAEGLAQGDGRKAELIGRAIKEWDGKRGAGWTQEAVYLARDMSRNEPDPGAVHREVGKALQTIAERAIADFGDTIEASEIELLNIIDECERLPEMHGTVRAGEAVVARQLEAIDGYLTRAYELAGTAKLKEEGSISDVEIQSLIRRCSEAKAAFKLLERRRSLLHKLPQNRIAHLSTVSVAVAFRLGWFKGRWKEARELTTGIQPGRISSEIDAETQRLFQVCCYAIPLMELASQGNDTTAKLEALKLKLPGCGLQIDSFVQRARILLEGNLPAVTPLYVRSPNNVSPAIIWCCLVAVFAVVGFLIPNLVPKDSNRKAGERTYRVPASKSSEVKTERTAIEIKQRLVKTLFDEVESSSRNLDTERLLLNQFDRLSVSVFNAKVSAHNALAQRARQEQAQLNQMIADYNAKLAPYGR